MNDIDYRVMCVPNRCMSQYVGCESSLALARSTYGLENLALLSPVAPCGLDQILDSVNEMHALEN